MVRERRSTTRTLLLIPTLILLLPLLPLVGCQEDSSTGNSTLPTGGVQYLTMEGKDYVSIPGSPPLEVTGLGDDDEVPLILETEPGRKEEVAARVKGKAAAKLPYVFCRVKRRDLGSLDRRGVSVVHPDAMVELCLDQSVPLVKDPAAWSALETRFGRTLDGAMVRIAFLDTGIDPGHPDFAGRIVATSVFTGEASVQDGHGHGTHVASIAAGSGAASGGRYKGVAPGASIMAGKVMYNSGSGFSSDIIAGIEWAVANGAGVISMSFGGGPTDGTDPLSQSVNWAHEQGVIVAVAAGNSGGPSFKVAAPGVAAKAVTVGAMNNSRELAGFSSRGPTPDGRIKPDVLAPGVSIVAARAAGTSMGTAVDSYYTTASGTSMATPHVAGMAALLRQARPTWSSDRLKNAILLSARDAGYRAWEQGLGSVDAARSVDVDVVLSNQGQVGFGYIFEGSVSRTFTVVEGAASFGESDAYLALTPSSGEAGTTVTASYSLPDTVGGLVDAPITVTTATNTYRAVAMYFRTSKITARVVTTDPALAPTQKSFFAHPWPTSQAPYSFTWNDTTEMVALVKPGTYTFFAQNPRVQRADGTTEVRPYVLASSPITVTRYGETVGYDFALERSYEIPVRLDALGGSIGQAVSGAWLTRVNTWSSAMVVSGSSPIASCRVGDMPAGQVVHVGVCTADSASGAIGRAHLLNWRLLEVRADNRPAFLEPGELTHYSLRFEDAKSASRHLNLLQNNFNVGLGRSMMPAPFSMDLYAMVHDGPFGSDSEAVVPGLHWFASTWHTSKTYAAYQASTLRVLPYPSVPSRTITVGSGGTIPSAPASVSADFSTNPPTFSWAPVSHPAGVTYQVYVGDGKWGSSMPGPLVKSPIHTELFVPGTSYTPPLPLPKGANAFWVRAIADDGNLGVWPAPLRFTISSADATPPAAPSLLSPADGASLTDGTPLFDWSDAADPSGVLYELQVDASPTFDPPVLVQESWLRKSYFDSRLGLGGGTWYWRVRARDGAGNVGAWSMPRTLTIAGGSGDTSGPTMAILSPLDGATVAGKTAVAVSASDPSGVARVEFSVDGQVKSTDSVAPWSWTWNTRPYKGRTVTLTARGVDALGNARSVSVRVSVP